MRAIPVLAVLAVFPLAAGPSPRPAEPHWVMVGHHVDGGPVEVDARSITPWGALTRGRWRITFAQPRPDGTVIETHFDAIDCTRGVSTALEQVTLHADGSVIDGVREAPNAAITRLSPSTPGTTGDLADRAICRLRPPPPRAKHPR